ncbi:MAG: DUF885 domain-containing protein [Gammaproteobacteria bacterium]|nr:DUF885 domain-containing protein [Gammaproteobacteria bacterium]MBU2280267.1 DUF885 domain-containing protein [Gammaproteobacteria bacterium]
MRLSILSLAVASSLFLTHCTEAPKPAQSTTAEVPATAAETTVATAQALYDKATQTLFQARALSASAYGLTEQQVGKNYKAELEFFDSKHEGELRIALAKIAAELAAMPIPEDAVAADNQLVMANIIGYYAGDSRFPQGYIDPWMGHSAFIINQINGPTIDMPGSMVNSHPINNEQDAKNYLARLELFGPALKSISDKFNTDVKSGWIPPRVLLDKAQNILKNYGNSIATEHPLYLDFAAKLSKVSDLTDEQKQPMLQLAAKHISTVVAPGYQQLLADVVATLPHGRSEAGIWAQPNGSDFYAYSVSQLGDTDLTPDQIHQIGLDEVARISKEMDVILKANGYNEGSVGDRMTALAEEPRFLYPDSDAGRAELLAALNGYIAEMDLRMPEQFATKPPYAVEVRRIPVEVQDSAAGGQYTSPSIDGSKPGIYWINLADMKANSKFDLKTLTYHEANPGHHWQIALNLAQEQLPLLRRIAPYNAYAEGWGLYSELVAYEMGMYKDDAFGNLGRLKAELFRSVRLVVDTGMHAKKWTREQAIQYMAQTTGTASSDVISEIERYMAWPGQALGYKLGMLKIVELRELARTELGAQFDIRAFHDLVLLSGAVPMKVLEQKVKHWIASQKQPATA